MNSPLRVVELFAGVGGFRLGLEGRPGQPGHQDDFEVVWSNQWEPSTGAQHASDCYAHRFGHRGHVNADIAALLDWQDGIEVGRDRLPAEARIPVPEHDVLVGGFPCQDYSVAKPAPMSQGIAGKKGVLWWEINRILERHRPRWVLLENVDRLLSSTSSAPGRDFAVILSCLSRLGYRAEWRTVNAADYGFPQRRRRVFIVAEHTNDAVGDPLGFMAEKGVLARALPVEQPLMLLAGQIHLPTDPYIAQQTIGREGTPTPWLNTGVMEGDTAWSIRTTPQHAGGRTLLRDVMVEDAAVPDGFYVDDDKVASWRECKAAKSIDRVTAEGHQWTFSEGALPFPDPTDRPARTVLTGEGGASASRTKHIIEAPNGRLRRLTPVELERLNGFPDGWTAEIAPGVAMPDTKRAFCMGNALVVGLVERISEAIREAG